MGKPLSNEIKIREKLCHFLYNTSGNPIFTNLRNASSSCYFLILVYLFVKVHRPGGSEGTVSSSRQTATCYYLSNHSR